MLSTFLFVRYCLLVDVIVVLPFMSLVTPCIILSSCPHGIMLYYLVTILPMYVSTLDDNDNVG